MKGSVITLPAYSAIICRTVSCCQIYLFQTGWYFLSLGYHASLGIYIKYYRFPCFNFSSKASLVSAMFQASILQRSAVNLSPLNEFCEEKAALRSMFPLKILQVNFWCSFYCSFLILNHRFKFRKAIGITTPVSVI